MIVSSREQMTGLVDIDPNTIDALLRNALKTYDLRWQPTRRVKLHGFAWLPHWSHQSIGRFPEDPAPGVVEKGNLTSGAIPLWLIMAATSIAPIVSLRRWAKLQARKTGGLCLMLCGYNLTGNVSGACPECGIPTKNQSPRQIRTLPTITN